MKVYFEINGQPRSTKVPDRSQTSAKAARPKADQSVAGQVGAPMPGVIASIAVTVGQTVRVGDGLLSIEAMKMETGLSADRAGVVKALHVTAGSMVETNDLLVEIE